MTTQPPTETVESSDPVRVETEHVAVEKTIAAYAEDVLKIAFVVESTANEPVELHLRDPLPETVDRDAVGFHPRFDPENWHLDDGTVIFEGRLEPGETREPFYGVRVAPSDELAAFRATPAVEVTPLEPAVSAAAAEESTDVAEPDAAAAVEAGADDGPSAESDGTNPTDSSSATVESDGFASDESSTRRDDDARPPTTVATDGEGGVIQPSPDEPARPGAGPDLVAAFVDALREQELSAEQHAVLRERLSPAEGADPADDNGALARLRHVQARVDDLVAYSEALEAFVAEHGEASAVVSALQDGLDDLQGTVHGAVERLSAAEDRLDELDRRLGDLATVEAQLEERGDQLDALRDRVAAAEADHADAVAGLDDRLARLETAHETRVSALTNELDDLRTTVERVDRWRANLSEAAAQPPDEA